MFHHISNWYIFWVMWVFATSYVVSQVVRARAIGKRAIKIEEQTGRAPDWDAEWFETFKRRGEAIDSLRTRVIELERDNARLTRKLAKARRSRDANLKHAQRWRHDYDILAATYATVGSRAYRAGFSAAREAPAKAPTHE